LVKMKGLTGSLSFRTVALLLGCCALSVNSARALDQGLHEAEDRYKRTDYEGSLSLLNKQTEDAGVNFLMARDYFMLGDYKRATDCLQKAIASQPANGEYVDWLGKIYGRRAETSNPLLAPALAVKARQAFERSVELDPRNSEALDDLFDYYLEAPALLGGGYDKAAEVARRIAAVDPPEGHYAKAKLAQKRKEFSDAESHLRQAIAAAPHAVGHTIALARFLAKQGRNSESDDVLLAAQKDQPNAATVWFARADILIQQNRDLEEAKRLLQKYMHAPLTVDDPPKEQALRLLKQVGGA
jgi:tetratricopeptide (TPR) repeat protein